TVAPLAKDPAIQQAAAHRVAEAVAGGRDLTATIRDALPARAAFLAPSIQAELQRFVQAAALRVLESDQFATIWERGSRVAHRQVLAVLEGKGTAVQTKNGRVVVDLGVVVDRVKARLDALGIDVFDDVNPQRVNRQIVLVQSESLGHAQDAVSLL